MPNTINHPALALMLEQSTIHQMPKAYHGDLVIDASMLLCNPQLDYSEPFVWILREHGTHLWFGLDIGLDLHTLFEHETRRFYVWDGKKLIGDLMSGQAARLVALKRNLWRARKSLKAVS